MNNKTELERAIEQKVGESIESIREMPIDERRRITEKKYGVTMIFRSLGKLVGRGNVLRDRTISRKEVEEALDKALHK